MVLGNSVVVDGSVVALVEGASVVFGLVGELVDGLVGGLVVSTKKISAS